MFFKELFRAGLHYRGYTARDMVAMAHSGGLIYSGNGTFAFEDKLPLEQQILH